MLLSPHPTLASLDLDWTFRPSAPLLRAHVLRMRDRALRRVPAPAWRVLIPPPAKGAWTVYFMYLPQPALTDAHRFTLARLRALDRRLMVVCATADPSAVPEELPGEVDSLLWKALPGFDFSGYTAGLLTLSEQAPGSDALVLNDSVFGPFGDLSPWIARAKWVLTGFTATSNLQNHIQSYAFLLKDVTPARMASLRGVFMPRHAFQHFRQVVLNQETRLATVAARSGSVGSILYADDARVEDPTLQLALPLLEAGFPFIKRSLLGGKLAHLYPRAELEAALRAVGHPV